MKIAVVSAIFGGIDIPFNHVKQSIPCDWYLFTDKPVRKPDHTTVIDSFSHIEIDNPRMELPVYKAKYYRCQGHKIGILSNYDYLVWLDGRVEVVHPDLIKDLVECAGDWCAFWINPFRDCAYDEADFCKQVPKYLGEPFNEQKAAYEKASFPRHYGLWSAGIHARKLSETNHVWDFWWNETLKHSFNCQISLSYAFWYTGRRPNEMPGNVYRTKYMKLRDHLK